LWSRAPGDGKGACHFNVTSFRMADYAIGGGKKLVGETCRGTNFPEG